MIKILVRFLFTLKYIFGLLKDGFLNPYGKVECDVSNKLLILANGPSLKQFLESFKSSPDDYSGFVFSVVNDFVNDDLFTVIKPCYYTLSDPMYFTDTIKKEQGLAVIKALKEKVDWDMYLHVAYRGKKKNYIDILKQNPHIKIIQYHANRYIGSLSMRNWFFKHGLGNGEYSTVVLNSLYSAITEGYRDIELYGVDHTFFTGLMVNEDNVPCYAQQHFYDDKVVIKPMINHYSGGSCYYDMASFLYEKYDIFKGHKIMASYAKYMNAKVVNCTPGSLIDAYERKK